MKDKLKEIIAIILDPTARIDEIDDAIMFLGELGDLDALDILIDIGSDESNEYISKASAGESIARLMISNNIFRRDLIEKLSEDAKNEAIQLITGLKPEWLKQG